jgi:hypothetical protein
MSNDPSNSAGKKPDYIAYNVKETNQGKALFNPVGAAWPDKDGQGLAIRLDSIPVDGRVTLRKLREDPIKDYQQQLPQQSPKGHDHGQSR